MVVYRLDERSRDSGLQLKHSSAGPRGRCFGAHGQVALAGMGVMAFVLAAAAFVIGVPTDQNVDRIIAGDNITISPENGYGIVTINSTGIGGNGAVSDNNVTKIIAGDNVAISPENGYGEVTITASGYDNTQNVQRIIAGENVTVSPESGYGEVTVGVLIDNIRPSQLYEAPVPADDGKFPQYEESYDMFTWISLNPVVILYSETVSVAKTTISITGLNLDVDKIYYLDMVTNNTTGSNDELYFDYNLDSDGNHYYVQWLRAIGTTVSGEREQRRGIGWGTTAGTANTYRFTIMRPFEDGEVKMWGSFSWNDGSNLGFIQISRTWTVESNLTRIDITSSVANAIGIGSHIRLWTVR